MKIEEFPSPVFSHQSVPVVDDHDRLLGVVRRNDLLSAGPTSTASELLRYGGPVAYPDESIADIASRFAETGFDRCPVLERETGELVGMLTSFDLLNAKDVERAQDLPEPGRLWGLSLARLPQERKKTA